MANRRFRSQYRFGEEAMVVDLYLKVAIGATGAPTMDTNLSKGIASIVRNSAGQYTVTLKDKYMRLIHASVDQRNGTSAAAAPIAYVEAEDVDGAKTIVLQYYAIDNSTPTDPGSGEEQRWHFILSNSSVGN